MSMKKNVLKAAAPLALVAGLSGTAEAGCSNGCAPTTPPPTNCIDCTTNPPQPNQPPQTQTGTQTQTGIQNQTGIQTQTSTVTGTQTLNGGDQTIDFKPETHNTAIAGGAVIESGAVRGGDQQQTLIGGDQRQHTAVDTRTGDVILSEGVGAAKVDTNIDTSDEVSIDDRDSTVIDASSHYEQKRQVATAIAPTNFSNPANGCNEARASGAVQTGVFGLSFGGGNKNSDRCETRRDARDMASSKNTFDATAGRQTLIDMDPRLAVGVRTTTVKFLTLGECAKDLAEKVSPTALVGVRTLEECEPLRGMFNKPTPVVREVEVRYIEVPAEKTEATPVSRRPAASVSRPAPAQRRAAAPRPAATSCETATAARDTARRSLERAERNVAAMCVAPK